MNRFKIETLIKILNRYFRKDLRIKDWCIYNLYDELWINIWYEDTNEKVYKYTQKISVREILIMDKEEVGHFTEKYLYYQIMKTFENDVLKGK